MNHYQTFKQKQKKKIELLFYDMNKHEKEHLFKYLCDGVDYVIGHANDILEKSLTGHN